MATALSDRDREILLAYRDLSRTVAEVTADLAVTPSQLRAVIRRAREPFRRPASANRHRAARHAIGIPTSQLLGLAAAPPGPDEGGGEPLPRRVERMLVAQIVDLEDRRAGGAVLDPERVARLLATSVRALAAVQKMTPPAAEEAASVAAEPPPRTLSELRDELRRHLERIRDEERARRGLGPDEADEGGGRGLA